MARQNCQLLNYWRHLMWVNCFLTIFLAASSLANLEQPNDEMKFRGSVDGDIILGGLFPMHERNISRPERPCGEIKEEKGIQVRQV